MLFNLSYYKQTLTNCKILKYQFKNYAKRIFQEKNVPFAHAPYNIVNNIHEKNYSFLIG